MLRNKTCSIRQDRSHTMVARHHDFVSKYYRHELSRLLQ